MCLLSKSIINKKYKIRKINIDSKKSELYENEIFENSEILILNKALFSGPILIKINNKKIALRNNITKNIELEKI